MLRNITPLVLFAAVAFAATSQTLAERTHRQSNSSAEPAAARSTVAGAAEGADAVVRGDAVQAEAGAAQSERADYIMHCCPAPRGYTPIKCDPNAYNCFRAMRGSSRFPYRFRPGW